MKANVDIAALRGGSIRVRVRVSVTGEGKG